MATNGKVGQERPLLDSGEERLVQLGYKQACLIPHYPNCKQELRRNMSHFNNFAIMFAEASIMTGITATYGIAFNDGGPVAVTWSWVIVSIFSMNIVLSLAEICSSLPTTGGPYFWAYHLGGSKLRAVACWMTGWFNLLGWLGGCASVDFACAIIISNMVLIATGGALNGGRVITNAELYAIFAGIVILQGIVNSIGGRLLKVLNAFAVVWNIFGVLVLIIMLPCVAVTTKSASYVFTEYTRNPELGISSDGYAFLVGLLFAQYTLGGYDVAAHLSEETRTADVGAAWSMVWSLAISIFLGAGYMLSITFSIQNTDWDHLGAGEAGGNIIGQIFYDVFVGRYGHSGGAVVALGIPMIAIFFAGMGCQTAQSRMTWAFARDGALPFSRVWHKVNRHNGIPVNVVWLSVLLALLITLPLLHSQVAFNAVVAIGAIGGFLAYLICITLKLIGAQNWRPGPFHLGRFSVISNIFACIWIAFVCVVFCLPTVFPVNSLTFNYAPVAVGGTVLLAMGAWWFPVWGVGKWFTGPVPNITFIPDVVDFDVDKTAVVKEEQP